MQLHNLDKNILYRLCKELTDRNRCDFLETDSIYHHYSDIPDENIAAGIQSCVDKGWLKENQNRTRLYLTDSGWAKIRAAIPAKLLSTCEKPLACEDK